MGFTQALQGVGNVKSLVANDEIGFKVFNFKGPSKSSKVSRHPIGKYEVKFKE
jgi:hypothetical protein